MNARKRKDTGVEIIEGEIVPEVKEPIPEVTEESKSEDVEQVSSGGMATPSDQPDTSYASTRPSFMRAYSRHEQRKMQAQMKRAIKPKRGHTKPLHNKAKSKAYKHLQQASRRANRISRQRLKARV